MLNLVDSTGRLKCQVHFVSFGSSLFAVFTFRKKVLGLHFRKKQLKLLTFLLLFSKYSRKRSSDISDYPIFLQ